MALYGEFWNNSHWLVSKTGALKFRKNHPELYPFVHNQRLSPAEASALYRKTRINLNIHHPDSRTGANPRTFEILGNNNFELCDARDFSCTSLVPGQHLAVYHDVGELEELLVYYLEHDKERIQIAKNGGEVVRNQYMFSHVIARVLSKEAVAPVDGCGCFFVCDIMFSKTCISLNWFFHYKWRGHIWKTFSRLPACRSCAAAITA